MYCKNCGNKVEETEIYCYHCGTKQKEDPILNQQVIYVQSVNVESPEDKKSADMLCIISLILFFGVPLISTAVTSVTKISNNVISIIAPFCELAGIVLMIVARVKYPYNKFAKILMWIYIVLIGLGIIGFIVMVFACSLACGGYRNLT